MAPASKPIVCDLCTMPIAPPATHGGTGYAIHYSGSIACYACCAWLDCIEMMRGKAPAIYASGTGRGQTPEARNWPGSLRMPIVASRKGRHNLAGRKTVHHFRGPLGVMWTGTEYHGPASGDLLRNVHPLKGSR